MQNLVVRIVDKDAVEKLQQKYAATMGKVEIEDRKALALMAMQTNRKDRANGLGENLQVVRRWVRPPLPVQ